MVRLYLLGFTHDLKGVVFSERRNGKTATFWVPIDDKFNAAIGEARARPQGSRPHRTEAVRSRHGRPRRPVGGHEEACAPARSGGRRRVPGCPPQRSSRCCGRARRSKRSPQASKAPLAWVERLAEPVLTERIGVVRLAQRAYMNRARLGRSSMQLGDAVARNLEDRRAAMDNIDLDAAWDARQMASGSWRVWVRFSHRGKRRVAEWDFTKGSRTITPRNRLGAQIGWWAPDPEVAAPEAAKTEDGDNEEKADEPKPNPPRRRATKRQPSRATRSRPAARSKKRAPARKKKSVPARKRNKPVARKKKAPARRPARRRR